MNQKTKSLYELTQHRVMDALEQIVEHDEKVAMLEALIERWCIQLESMSEEP